MASRRRWGGWWGLLYGLISAVTLVLAGEATWRIRELRASAAWLEERVRTQVDDYQATLRSRFVDEEMQSFKERRQLAEAETGWWQLRLAVLMFWVVASFAYYILRTVADFAEEVKELPLKPPAGDLRR